MIRPDDPAHVRLAPLPRRGDIAEVIQMALSGWCPAPLAGLEALVDRMGARA